MQVKLLFIIMDIENWKSQLRKGAAELVILTLIGESPRSGFDLLESITTYPNIGLSEGTMYPLLRRLEREKRIKGQWVKRKEGGRPLKVYSLTKSGQNTLKKMQSNWHDFNQDLLNILGVAHG